jgi:O-antigen ligase
MVVTVGVAAVSLRGSAVTAFLEFLGVRAETRQTQTHVETYAHRTLLGYIGLKIWLDHPIVGVGWQESMEPAAFTPHLAAAHRRFPTEPALAFPAPNHKWGVQNGIIQTAADLGIVGLLLLLAAVADAFWLALRAALDRSASTPEPALVALAWLWVSFAVFTGTGLLAGAAVDTLLWISIGLAAAVSARPVHDSLPTPR